MRTLITQLVVGMLLMGVGGAIAAQRPHLVGDENLNFRGPRPVLAGQGHAMLTLSPMFLEIQAIFEASAELEHKLLDQLASAKNNEIAVRLVQRLQRIDIDRQLDVLRVRLRYAQSVGQYDQIYRLRQEILELMRGETAALM